MSLSLPEIIEMQMNQWAEDYHLTWDEVVQRVKDVIEDNDG